MKMIKCFIVFVLCLVSISHWAQSTYLIDSLYPVHPLDERAVFFKDTSNQITISEIRGENNFHFLPLSQQKEKFVRNSTYWAKLRLYSEVSIKDWLLQLEEENYGIGSWGRGNSRVDIWSFSGQNLNWHRKSGTEYPRKEKDIKVFWNQNRINFDINARDSIDLYIRLEGNKMGFAPYFNMALRSPQFQNNHPFFNRYSFLNIVLFGAVLILLFYYLLSYYYLKEDVFKWFSLWLFFSALAIAINTDIGLINEYILNDFPKLQSYLWAFFSNSIWYTFWFFGREYVGTKEKYPLLDKVICGLILLIFIESISYLIIPLFPLGNTPLILILSNPISLIFKVAGLVIAVILTCKKDKLSQFFGYGAILANLTPIIGVLWVTGVLNLSFDPYTWGVILQLIAYSFGLAYRTQLKNQAFKKSQQDLLNVERASIELRKKVELDEVKSRFFANISHEFRTPLSLIIGPLKLAKKPEEPNITISNKTYEIIERNTERLKELIDQLLELSKIESGLTQFKLTQGGMMQFINSIASDYESMAESKNIKYVINLPLEDNNAFFDKDKLHKIVHNLLSNAFKYTPNGQAIAFKIESDKDQLLLEITDTGPGIPAAEIDKIFDRFYRIESSESKGSGIGLALTKELIDLLNGKVEVKSQLGIGTSFIVTLPVRRELLPQSDAFPESVEQLSDIEHFNRPNEFETKEAIPSVLIVEDNNDLRLFISDILSPHYSIIIAENGEIGEKLAKELIPNIIVSDVMMPKKNGFELCKELKSNMITSHIPIILLTAKAGQENKMSGLTYGADAYMTKPFDSEELLVRINNFIEARTKIWNQFKTVGGSMIKDLSLSSIDDQFFQKIQSVIKEQLSNDQFTVEDLAKSVGFSRSQLHRKLKALINKSANQLIRETRLEKAKMILETKSMNVSETAYEVGFNSLSYFAKSFKDYFGYLPSDLK